MKEMFSQSNNRSLVSPLSPVSDNGSGDVSINLSAIPSDKLFAVLQNIEDDCRFCAKKTGEHVHYIVSSQLVIDPSIELPKLVDIEPKKCYACGNNNNSDLKLCSQCKTATYCDTRCQLNDWSKHSAVCGVECNGMDVTDTSVSRIIESRSKPKNNISIVSPKSVAKEAPKESTPIIEANSAPKQSLNSASTLVRTVPNASSAKTVESKPKIKPYKLDIEYEQIKTGDSVSVCFGRNPSDFYVHKDSNLNKIEDISEKLTKIESFEFTESNLPKDAACIGLYEPDGLWYRASVVGKVSANEYALQFIDYGNTERVTRDNIKALPSQFFDIKAQATHCKLSSIVPIEREWSEKACIYFGKLGETQEYAKCVVKDNIDGIYAIDLVNKDGDAVSNELVKKNVAKTEHMDKDDGELVNVSKVGINDVSPKASPNKNEKSLTKSPQVIFNKTSVNSDGKRLIPLQAQLNQLKATKRNISSIVCSLNANDSATALATDIYNKDKGQYWAVFDGTKYSQLYENLQKEYTANKLDCEPNVGDFVVIKASDEDFYRAFVFDSQNDKFKVLMIDTGYIEEVSCAYVLDPKYYRYSAFSMLVIARNSEGKAKLQDFYEESQSFEPLVISQNEGEAVIKIDGLLFDALAFNLALDKVVNAIEAQPIDFIDALGSRDIDLNKKMEVLVLYQNTEDKNIFHIAGDADSLTDVMGKCASSGEKFEDAIQPKSGDIYLVKHSDGEWYRALILSTGNTIVAFFIDFGNTDDITPEFIMALPSELSISSIPGIAIKCVVNPSQKNLKDIHKKIEKAADGTYLLKIEATNKEGNAFHVNVY